MLKIFYTTLLVCLGIQVFAQSKIDSIATYDVNLSDYMTTNGKVYLANGKAITKDKYEFYKESWKKASACQPCEVYTYNEFDQLKHIAIQYEGCLVGSFKEYYPDGKIKVEGNFRNNESSDWSNLRLRGLCSIREGKWNYYNDAGKLTLIETYENGLMIHKEEIKDEDKSTSPSMTKIKGFFKKNATEQE